MSNAELEFYPEHPSGEKTYQIEPLQCRFCNRIPRSMSKRFAMSLLRIWINIAYEERMWSKVRNKRSILVMLFVLLLCLTACSPQAERSGQAETDSNETKQEETSEMTENNFITSEGGVDLPTLLPGETAVQTGKYVDENGDIAIIPKGFTVSKHEGEHTVNTGVVVIGPDESEFVWIPTTKTPLAVRDFGSYVSWGANFSGYYDETNLKLYQEMVESTKLYGGFYMGRFEASYGGGDDLSDYFPASKRILNSSDGRIWVRFSPQDVTVACQNLYADNDTVQGFFPWGINYDTVLQWIIDSGCKTENEVTKNSTSWGNYSNDTFSQGADGSTTGKWEETKANNIYDLAGNNWEWTQERYGSDNYVMRGGGYNLMGGTCRGSDYPAALRDPLPGSGRHPNVVFRVALFVK